MNKLKLSEVLTVNNILQSSTETAHDTTGKRC